MSNQRIIAKDKSYEESCNTASVISNSNWSVDKNSKIATLTKCGNGWDISYHDEALRGTYFL